MNAWQMYLLTRADSFNGFFTVASILSAICLGIFFIFGGMCVSEKDMTKETYHFYLKIIVSVLLFSVPFSLFIPTSKEIAAIFVVPKIVNNAKVQEIPDKLLTLATEWMDELRPDKK